jgi:hypothetical protein
MPRTCNLSSYNEKGRGTLHTVNIFIMLFSLVFNYFIFLISRYSPQHFVLKRLTVCSVFKLRYRVSLPHKHVKMYFYTIKGCPTANQWEALLCRRYLRAGGFINIYFYYSDVNISPAIMRSMKHIHTNKCWTHKIKKNIYLNLLYCNVSQN